jgi:hypothetical protein
MWWIIGILVVAVAVAVGAVIVYRRRQSAVSEQHYAGPQPIEDEVDEDEEEVLPVANADGLRTGYAAARRAVNEDEDDYFPRQPEVYHRQVTMINQQPLPDYNFDGIPDVFEQQPAPTYDTPAPDPTPAYEPPAPQQDTYCPPTPDPTPSYDPTPSAPAPDYCPAPDPTPSGNDYGNTSNDYGNSGW